MRCPTGVGLCVPACRRLSVGRKPGDTLLSGCPWACARSSEVSANVRDHHRVRCHHHPKGNRRRTVRACRRDPDEPVPQTR